MVGMMTTTMMAMIVLVMVTIMIVVAMVVVCVDVGGLSRVRKLGVSVGRERWRR